MFVEFEASQLLAIYTTIIEKDHLRTPLLLVSMLRCLSIKYTIVILQQI
jgi:hypothetical protein